jgi:hypothetical protein
MVLLDERRSDDGSDMSGIKHEQRTSSLVLLVNERLSNEFYGLSIRSMSNRRSPRRQFLPERLIPWQ